MAKLTLSDLSSLTNQTSAITTLNNNNTATEAALENTLSRNGAHPNAMEANLDMNSHRILNLPAPVAGTEPVRLADFEAFQYGAPSVSTISTINSVAQLQLTTVGSAEKAIYLSGYYEANDGGQGWWGKVANPSPVKSWYVRSADGAYWQPSLGVNGVFDVNQFGAIGNGTSNDTTAWQHAIDAANNAGGGTIVGHTGATYLLDYVGAQEGFPGNVDLTNYCLLMRSNVAINGNNCTFKLADSGQACLFLNANSTATTDTNMSIRSIRINGNRANNAHISLVDQAAIYFFGVSDSHIEDVYGYDITDRLLRLYGCTGMYIDNLVCDGSDGDGFCLGTGSTGATLYELYDSYIGYLHTINAKGLHGEEAVGNGFAGAVIDCVIDTIKQDNCAAGIKIMDTAHDTSIGTVRFDGGDGTASDLGTGNSGIKIQGRVDLSMYPSHITVGRVIVNNANGIGVFLENCNDCSIGSYIGHNNSKGGDQLPDLWLGAGNRNSIGSIQSNYAHVSAVYLRNDCQNIQIGHINVLNPGTAGSGLSGNGYSVLCEAGCKFQIGHVRAVDTRGTPVMLHGLRAQDTCKGIVSSVWSTAAIEGATVLPGSGVTVTETLAD